MLNSYVAVKQLHLAAITLTLLLFLVRTAWMLASPQQLTRRWVRVVPHVIDTVLLLSGVWLAFQIGAAGVKGWLPAKLGGLVVYIGLGTLALKRGRTRNARIAAAVAAVFVFAWIASVAITKSPLGFFGG